MRWLMVGCWAALVLPPFLLGAWTAPALLKAWRRAHPAARGAWLGLWILGSVFLFARPHDDTFTGLDNMAYRDMAGAFLAGRSFHATDTVLREVPVALREAFLFQPREGHRPTRDRVFQLTGPNLEQTVPFFLPLVPLAAAAPAPLLPPESFLPSLGSLWLAVMLTAGFCAGGAWGLAAAVVLVLGSAWPAWFLRGFHVEAVGAVLVSCVLAAAGTRPLRNAILPVAGFALGLAVSCHPLLLVIALPTGLALALEQHRPGTIVRLCAGALAGLFPFWAMTRWICRPYGDWTRWRTLRQVAFSCPEHRAMALGLAGLAALTLLGFGVLAFPRARALCRRLDARARPWGWAALIILPWLPIPWLPGLAAERLRQGAAAAWSGIRMPFAIWILAGVAWTLRADRRIRERFLLAALSWSALLPLYLQGVEIPVGLWSQRRFLPVILAGIGLLLPPSASALAAWVGSRNVRRTAAALACLAAGLNLARWPTAYVTVNQAGAATWTKTTRTRLNPNVWTFFDYYPHGVPGAATLQRRTLGLGEHARQTWPDVVPWLAEIARTQETWIVSSWTPCTLEESLRLHPVLSVTGEFPVVRTKAFFPALPGTHKVRNTFLRVEPLAHEEAADQEITFDGSPLGLRGPWGSFRGGGAWTRQGSGVLGPVPAPGARVRIVAEGDWFPPETAWQHQTLRIEPPWGGDPLRFDVHAGQQRLEGALQRPAGDSRRPGTGVYTLRVDRPYDPTRYGLRGYASDLGVLLRHLHISKD